MVATPTLADPKVTLVSNAKSSSMITKVLCGVSTNCSEVRLMTSVLSPDTTASLNNVRPNDVSNSPAVNVPDNESKMKSSPATALLLGSTDNVIVASTSNAIGELIPISVVANASQYSSLD